MLWGDPHPRLCNGTGELGHWCWTSEALGLWERKTDEAQPWGLLVRLRWFNQGQRVGRVSVGARDGWEWTSSRKD